MAELNKGITIKVKDGYSAKDVESFLASIGARIDNSSGNTVNATISSLAFNHIKAHYAVGSVVYNTPDQPQEAEKNVLPSPGGDTPIEVVSEEEAEHLNPPEKKKFWA